MTERETLPARCLLDTSVFVAFEVGRPVDRTRLPKQVSVSVITHAELQAGVLAADDLDIRSRRMQTIRRLASMNVLPIDQMVATGGRCSGRPSVGRTGELRSTTCGLRRPRSPMVTRSDAGCGPRFHHGDRQPDGYPRLGHSRRRAPSRR